MRTQEQGPLTGLHNALAGVSSSLFNSKKQPKRWVRGRSAGPPPGRRATARRGTAALTGAPAPSHRSMLGAARPAPARVSMRAPFAAIIPGDSVVEQVMVSGLDSFL
jgi:hypothetical protein